MLQSQDARTDEPARKRRRLNLQVTEKVTDSQIRGSPHSNRSINPLQERDGGFENEKKCDIYYMKGHDILAQNVESKQDESAIMAEQNEKINVLDMGLRSLLTHKSVYRDTMYKELLLDWSKETLIPMEHLVVYNFTERNNQTMRTNAQIKVDVKEAFKGDGDWTDDEIKRHLVRTNPTMKRISSIYHRIGNIMEKKRSFILLDDRKITTLEGPKSENNARTILVALKYFDILAQKMYFVDWLRIKTTSITFADISKYIESKLIPGTMANGGCLQSLYDLNMKMSEFEAKSNDDGKPKYQFYEEVAALMSASQSSVKIESFNSDVTVASHFHEGDIFVFQINPFHPYFSTLNPSKIANLSGIIIDDREQQSQLSMHFRCYKQEFKERGMFWHCAVDEFIKSQAQMIDIQIKVREKVGWDHQWSRALIHQCTKHQEANEAKESDETLHKKISRSIHKWKVDKRTTFGMIRKRLGTYYDIEPEHIEIWLPQKTGKDKWDYGSKGRGKWDEPLSDLIKHRSEWRKLCPLKFEIQTYNVKDFDKMTAYDGSKSPSSVDPIKHIALFQFFVHIPPCSTMVVNPIGLVMTYNKDWTAKDLIQSILDLVFENPVFLYSFFGHVMDYIRKYEMENAENTDISGDNVNDLDIHILRKLQPSRFLVVYEEPKPETGESFYMDEEYEMPDSFSQIKYTDFRLQFLAQNDPLVIQEEPGSTKETVAVWLRIYGSDTAKLPRSSHRLVVKKGESLKDAFLNSHLSNMCSKTGAENLKDTFSAMTKSNEFRLMSNESDGKGAIMDQKIWNRCDLTDFLTPDKWIRVNLPSKESASDS